MRWTVLASLAMCGLSNFGAHAQGVPVDGRLPDSAVVVELGAFSDDFRQVFLTEVVGDKAEARRPCAAGVTDGAPPIALTAPSLDLATNHAGDLTCALAQAGWLLLASRDRPERPVFYLLNAGQEKLVTFEALMADDTTLSEVSFISNRGLGGGTIVLRPRSNQLIGVSSFAKTRIVSPEESLSALMTLAEPGLFDLSEIGLGPPAGATAPNVEPGCAETGACTVAPCGPAPRDAPVLANAFFPADQKRDRICPTLAKWQTERHTSLPPDETLVRRALILALQALSPELDQTEDAARIIVEHSEAGTRLLMTTWRADALFTLPVFSQTVRDVSEVRCAGDDRAQTCTARVIVENFSRVVNMPSSVQAVLVETLLSPPQTLEQTLELRFERRNARWELIDPTAVGQMLFEPETGRQIKGPVSYFFEKMQTLP